MTFRVNEEVPCVYSGFNFGDKTMNVELLDGKSATIPFSRDAAKRRDTSDADILKAFIDRESFVLFKVTFTFSRKAVKA